MPRLSGFRRGVYSPRDVYGPHGSNAHGGRNGGRPPAVRPSLLAIHYCEAPHNRCTRYHSVPYRINAERLPLCLFTAAFPRMVWLKPPHIWHKTPFLSSLIDHPFSRGVSLALDTTCHPLGGTPLVLGSLIPYRPSHVLTDQPVLGMVCFNCTIAYVATECLTSLILESRDPDRFWDHATHTPNHNMPTPNIRALS